MIDLVDLLHGRLKASNQIHFIQYSNNNFSCYNRVPFYFLKINFAKSDYELISTMAFFLMVFNFL